MNVFMFTRTHTFGIPRYQVEIFGGVLLFLGLEVFKKFDSRLIYLALLLFNLSVFHNKWNSVQDNNYSNPIVMERLYPYDEAMTYIRNNGDYYKLYIAGLEYKGIALILNGATVQEYMNYVSNLNSIGINRCHEAQKKMDSETILVEDRFLSLCRFNEDWELAKQFQSKFSQEKIYVYRRKTT